MSTVIKILADASLPGLPELFKTPFSLTLYQNQNQIPGLLSDHNILLCRSTLHVNASLLANSAIQCVATASSGTDHIDNEYLNQHNIQLFDAKGSNAHSVADYIIATLKVLNPTGKSAGVIGVGEAGTKVVKRLKSAGFDVLCYDPLKAQFDDITTCDLICIHANLHDTAPYPSKNLINADFIEKLKPGVTIINAARGGIVDEEALLATTKPITYCTDVYCNEPDINPRIVEFATLCTPHIAGHSIEAKQAAVVQVSEQIHRFYGLPLPASLASADKPQDVGLYNPLTDTQILKAATDKKSAFLTQRKAHHRHDVRDQ